MLAYERKLRPRFRGALLGSAVGDALGFPFHGYSRSFMRSLVGPQTGSFVKHQTGYYPLGQYSDETQIVQAVGEAIIEAGTIDGQTVAEHMVPLWRDQILVARSPACTEAMERFVEGDVEWDGAGLPPGRLENGPLARVIPVALWKHAEIATLPADVEVVVKITHRDPRVMAAAASFAAALAYNVSSDDLILGNFLDGAAQAAGRFHGELAEIILDMPRILSLNEYRAFQEFATFVATATGDEPPDFEHGITENALHTVLAVLYYFLKNPFDYESAVERTFRAGGEADATCALTGALSGALLGEDAVPSPLSSSLLDGPAILDRADRLLARLLERVGSLD